MNKFADVSVVIPCYCCTKTIRRAVDSVLKQTVLPREIILVEDASPDNTLDVLEEIALINTPVDISIVRLLINGGAGNARNQGWISAKSKYIAFLDSDDSWSSEKIEIQYGLMTEHPQVRITAHKIELLSDDDLSTNILHGKEAIESSSGRVIRIDFFQLLFFNKFPTPAVMLRSDLLEEMSFKYRYSEDYDLWLRVLSKYNFGLFIDFPLSYVYKGTFGVSGLSSRLIHMELGELRNYFNLMRTGKIGLFIFLVVSFFSLIKFTRRVLISSFYKLRRIF